MAREHAKVGIEIWSDADFRDLTPQAQHLWFTLFTHAALTYCGVVDFHPGRLAASAREQTALGVLIAAQELSEKRWIVVDQDTDEVLVRGYIRHDEPMKQPKLAVSVAKAYAAIASNKIRAVVVHEVQRYRRENPDLSAWDHPLVKALIKQPAAAVQDVDPQLRPPSEQGHDLGYGRRYGHALPQTQVESTVASTPATATATATAPRSNDLAAPDGPELSTPRSRVSRLRVNFDRVQKRYTEQAGEPVSEELVLRLVTTVIGRARHQDGDRTGLVLQSLKQDWADEWSRLVFQVAS